MPLGRNLSGASHNSYCPSWVKEVALFLHFLLLLITQLLAQLKPGFDWTISDITYNVGILKKCFLHWKYSVPGHSNYCYVYFTLEKNVTKLT